MFVPENDIEQALVRASDHPTDRRAFAQMLMHTEIVVALMAAKGSIKPNRHVTATVANGSMLETATVSHEGRTHLAFFTAPSRAQAWCRTDHVVAREKARDMFARAPDMSYLLNPGSDYGKAFTPSEVKRLLAGLFADELDTVTVDSKVELLFVDETNIPRHLIAVLARELKAIRIVRGAWLMLAIRRGSSEWSWMLGVEHFGDWKAVRHAIRVAVRGGVLQNHLLDVKELDASPLSAKLRTGLAVIKPSVSWIGRLFG